MMQNEFSATEMLRTFCMVELDRTRSSVKSNCDAVFSTRSTRDECQCTRRTLFAGIECERTGVERALRHRATHFRYMEKIWHDRDSLSVQEFSEISTNLSRGKWTKLHWCKFLLAQSAYVFNYNKFCWCAIFFTFCFTICLFFSVHCVVLQSLKFAYFEYFLFIIL